MIDEWKLKLLEKTVQKECMKLHPYEYTIFELIDEIRLLNKQVEWLSIQCETLSGNNPILRQGMSKEQWTTESRRAAGDDNQGAALRVTEPRR